MIAEDLEHKLELCSLEHLILQDREQAGSSPKVEMFSVVSDTPFFLINLVVLTKMWVSLWD